MNKWKNYHESYTLTHNNSQILLMTDKVVSLFPQLSEQIFKNEFQDRIPHEFLCLGKFLTICRNGLSHDSQVITSGRSQIVLETHVCTKKGHHEYRNDRYRLLSSFPVLFWPCRPFLMISNDFLIFKKFLRCQLTTKISCLGMLCGFVRKMT